jgi:hypothetical protein
MVETITAQFLDNFIQNMETHDYNTLKQKRFELRIVERLLHQLERHPGYAKRLMLEAGDQLGMAWLMTTFPNFPVRLGTYKAPEGVDILKFIVKPVTSKIWRAFQELAADYPHQAIGLVFASQGDGVGDLLLRNINADRATDYWITTLPTLEPTCLEPLEGFIAKLKRDDFRF